MTHLDGMTRRTNCFSSAVNGIEGKSFIRLQYVCVHLRDRRDETINYGWKIVHFHVASCVPRTCASAVVCWVSIIIDRKKPTIKVLRLSLRMLHRRERKKDVFWWAKTSSNGLQDASSCGARSFVRWHHEGNWILYECLLEGNDKRKDRLFTPWCGVSWKMKRFPPQSCSDELFHCIPVIAVSKMIVNSSSFKVPEKRKNYGNIIRQVGVRLRYNEIRIEFPQTYGSWEQDLALATRCQNTSQPYDAYSVS